MKFKELLFLEQQDDWGVEPEQPEDNDGADNPQLPPEPDDDGEQPDQPEQPAEPGEPIDLKPKKISPTKQVKMKWMEETPGLTEIETAEAVEFFRRRKDNLRPYHPYGYIDPQTSRHWINLPEITSLVMRFPEMEPILSQEDRMKDLKNYPWDVMSYYMDTVQNAQNEIAETNIIPAIQKKPIEEKLEEAKRVWETTPANIFNDPNFKIRKIDSKHEAIVFGSIQRILKEKRDSRGDRSGSAYWCVTVPPNESRSNLWTNYRPGGYNPQGFYFVWDLERDETDKYYFTSVNPLPNQDPPKYSVVDLYNHTSSMSWDEVVAVIPKLQPWKDRLAFYGTTRKEETDLTLDQVSLTKGHKFYLGNIRDVDKLAYVDSGRHINDVEAFSTLPFEARKLYVAKTSTENNDVQSRFLCNDPSTPYGLLDFLYLENKPQNLYKFLHKLLKEQLGIDEGVLAIKKLILGTNWDRWLSDDEKHLTLIRKRPEGRRDMKQTKAPYGIVNTQSGDIVKHNIYVSQFPKPYLKAYMGPDGRLVKERFFFQKYVAKSGDGNFDQNEGFYMLYPQSAIFKKNGNVNENYLKGQYFELDEGEDFINSKLNNGEFIKM